VRQGRWITKAAVVLTTMLGALAGPAQAAGTVGSGTPGSCTEAALNTALAGGGSVVFNCGGGPVVIPITSTKVLTVTTSIDGAGQQITLDGGGATRLFATTYQFSPFTLSFRNLTLRNGRAADFGGAINLVYQERANWTTLDVVNVTFASNVAAAQGNDVGGGAIHAVGGIMNIANSAFTGNRGGNGGAIGQIQAQFTIRDTVFTGNGTHARVADGGSGGAIFIDGSSLGTLTLERCVFSGNTATNLGGAIHTYMYGLPSAMTIVDSTFASNAGTTNGGAIFHMNGGLTISGTTFSANTVVGQGGGLWVTNGGGGTPVAITNSTFTGNQATGTRPNSGSVGLGGAITNSGATSFTLVHVTIVGNHADWVGGGITGGATGTSLRNTIIANNTAANGGNPWNIQRNCSSTMGDGGGNLQWPTLNPNDANDRRCTAGVVFAEPMLGPLAANGGPTQTMAPLVGSPALNTGVACPPPGTDQRGVVRPQGPACDVGAVEGLPLADLAATATASTARPVPGQPIAYTVVVRNNGPTAVTGAAVADNFPATLTGVGWSCAASAGSSCAASGSGNIADTVSLPSGGTVTYSVNATVAPSAIRLVTHTATVTAPGNVADTNLANNSASVVSVLDHSMRLHTLTPCRIVDTRGAIGPVGGPVLGAQVLRSFTLVNRCGIPPTAWAVSANVVVTSSTAAGNLQVFPGGTPLPGASNLNYGAGQTRANNAVILLGPAGDVQAFLGQSGGTAHVLLDVNGYFQ